MATSNVILLRTEKAAQDLSALQFTFVKYDGSGNLVPAGAGDRAFVLEDTPKSGQHGTIALAGIAKVQAGGTIAAGAYVASDGSGHAVAATSTAVPTGTGYSAGTQGSHIVGQALEAAVSGDLVEIVIAYGLA